MPDTRRHFLGWDRLPIDAAVEWLEGEFGPDMGGTTLALPGARAGRLLRERLALALGPAWQPPRILTAGHLTDERVELDRPSAPRLLRTLAWEHGLRALTPAELRPLVAVPPAADDPAGWRRLAGEVRGLFGTLAAECLDFAAVRDGPLAGCSGGEQRRWEVLARAQVAAEDLLARAGFCDPHRGRLAAIEAGKVRRGGRVVLVGVAEMTGLLRRLLSVLPDVTALVFAPEELAGAFDALGCIAPAAWLERSFGLPLERWRMAEGPDDQARCALDAMARWDGRFPAERITIGAGDEEVVPFLERRLAERGVFARDAAGISLGRTAPALLLGAIGGYLARRRFTELATLLRHPDPEAFVSARVNPGPGGLLPLLDEYHHEHLPGPTPKEWLHTGPRGGAGGQERLVAAVAVLDELLAPFSGELRSLREWAAPVRGLLGEIYGERELDAEDEEDRLLAEGLRGLAGVLDGLHELPPSAAPEVPAAEALAVVLSESGSETLAPRASRPGEPAIELLGWLELAFDEAPALIVTGFNEGQVPESMAGDGWLPDGLRRELGLPDDEQRVARDLYTLEWLVRSREEVVFVTGRRSLERDPLRPSRLAFHCSTDEILDRVRHALQAGGARGREEAAPGGPAQELPRPADLREPESWSATAFAAWLESPYVFCLTRLARLDTLDDRARELDPLQFGDLAHEVLFVFGRSDLASSTDAEVISNFLVRALEVCCRRRFGGAALPAVELQRRQLAWRLRRFAEVQAARAEEGWRIQEVEWAPAAPVTLDVDGEAVPLKGRIDRIDRHADGRWAILDYKVGEGKRTPEKDHHDRGKKNWKKVQLPLYAHLARELVGEDPPELGYFNLGRSPEEVGVWIAAGWKPGDLAAALDAARGVVREVRAILREGRAFPLGRPKIYSPILAAACGQGLLAGVGEGGEDET